MKRLISLFLIFALISPCFSVYAATEETADIYGWTIEYYYQDSFYRNKMSYQLSGDDTLTYDKLPNHNGGAHGLELGYLHPDWTENTHLAAKTVIPVSKLSPNSTYQVSFWYCRRLCKSYEFIIDGAQTADHILEYNFNTDWSKNFEVKNQTMLFTTGSTVNNITISFRMLSGNGDWGGGFMWLDDVSAKRLVNGELSGDELITNGDFENIPSISEISSDCCNEKAYITWTNPEQTEKTVIEKFDEAGNLLKTEETTKESYTDDIELYKGYTYKLSCVFSEKSPYFGQTSEKKEVNICGGDSSSISGWEQGVGHNKPTGFDYAWVNISSDAYGGDGSAHIVYKAKYAAFTYCDIYQNISVKPSTKYSISMYTKASGITNANVKINNTQIGFLNTGAEWRENTYEYTTGSTETTLMLAMYVEESASDTEPGELWIDSVRVAESGSSTNLAVNGGFDTEEEEQIADEGTITEPLGEWTHYITHPSMKLSLLKCRAKLSGGIYLSNNIPFNTSYSSGVKSDLNNYTENAATCKIKYRAKDVRYALAYVNDKRVGVLKNGDDQEVSFSVTPGTEAILDVRLNGYRNELAELWITGIEFYDADGVKIREMPMSDAGFTDSSVSASYYGDNAVIIVNTKNTHGDYIAEIEPVLALYENGRLLKTITTTAAIKHADTKKLTFIVPYSPEYTAKLITLNSIKNLEPSENSKVIYFSDIEQRVIAGVSDSDFDELITAMVNDLKILTAECDAKDITCDNEKSGMYVMERFADYGKDDLHNGLSDRAAYVRDTLLSMYTQAKSNLEAYLSGDKTPLGSAKYVSSKSSAGTRTEYAKSTTGEDERPTYFLGFGHFSPSIEDMPFFENLGLNLLSPEIYMDNVMKNGTEITVDYAYIDYLKSVLNSARGRNMKVHILINTLRVPDWVTTKYTDCYTDGSINYSHPDIQRLIKRYIKVVVSSLEGYEDVVHSICLMNEPCVRAGSYDSGKFRVWLAERYGNDISKLNSAYQTSYSSFAEVPMPSASYTSPSRSTQAVNKYYDYIDFNDYLFAELNKTLFDECIKYGPQYKFQVKIQNQFHEYEYEYFASNESKLLRGTDPELLAEIYNINGCDAEAYLNAVQSIRSKYFYYDFLGSVNNLPIVNGEDHIYFDGDADTGREKVLNAACDAWQGALHGRSATAIWLWGRSYDTSNVYYASAAIRPDYVYETARACNDLNRLAYEVESFNTADAEAVVYYDKNLILRSRAAMGIMVRAYEALWDCGIKTGMVTDRTIESLDKCKILVLPETVYINQATLEKVNSFIENGGKVYIISTKTALQYDEHGNALDSALANSVRSKSELITATASNGEMRSPSLDTLTDRFMNTVKDISNVVIKDTSGNYIKDVEYQSAVQDGKTIISVCNYNMSSDKRLVIYVGGKEYTGDIVDLRTGEKQTGSFLLKSYVPTILEIDNLKGDVSQ